MSVVDGLVDSLRANWDDPHSWMVFADWLSDRDDERGRLIVLEQELTTATGERANALRSEIEAVGEAHRATWLEGWDAPDSAVLEWKHGFVVGVLFRDALRIGEVFGSLVRHPVARFLTSVRFKRLAAYQLAPVVQALGEGHVRELQFIDCGLRGKAVATLVQAECARTLRVLAMRNCGLGNKEAAVLASAPPLAGLEVLELSDNGLDPAGVLALATSRFLSDLTALAIYRNRLRHQAAQHLASGAMANLRVLDLYRTYIGDVGAYALASAASLSKLEVLDLSECQITAAGARQILESAALPSLRTLYLRGNVPSRPRQELQQVADASSVDVHL